MVRRFSVRTARSAGAPGNRYSGAWSYRFSSFRTATRQRSDSSRNVALRISSASACSRRFSRIPSLAWPMHSDSGLAVNVPLVTVTEPFKLPADCGRACYGGNSTMCQEGNRYGISDEQFACELLRDYLSRHFGGTPRCGLATEDPPDLVATLATGVRWGVEVTRAYQQVPLPGKEKLGSTEALEANLKCWAAKVGDRTAGLRKRRYVLHLGPGKLSLWGDTADLFDKKWKKEAEEAIRNHIASGEAQPLKRRGLSLRAIGEGSGWAFYVSPGGSAQIESTTASMLGQALSKKARMVPSWKGCFDQRWLLALNNYPLADDTNDVRSIVERLYRCDPEMRRLDGILWYARPGPSLVSVWQRRRNQI